jgi:signal transduction histidine kinase/CheY-like chemotaxis protein
VPCARIPQQEAERLARLQALCLLDTPPDPALEDVVCVAAALARTPIALVTLVDRDRQWFKANVGLEGAKETGRDVSFCGHAILRPDEPLVVEDAQRDPRFADNPLVTGAAHVRFYAGFPLLGSGDRPALGTLCVIDRVPRTLDARQIDALRALARTVERRIQDGDEICDLAQALERLRAAEDELQRTRGQLYDALESLDGALVMHDPRGRLTLANRAYAALRPEIDALRGSARVTDTGGPLGEITLVAGEHHLGDRWFSASSRPTDDGSRVTLLTDITMLKRIQASLLAARDAAEAGTRAKASFLATMSHEIRTPMNGVIGMTALLAETALSAEQREYVETIHSCGESLLALINDILDFSKLEAGKLSLEAHPFDPRALIEDVAGLLVASADAKGVRLITNLVGIVHAPKGDAARLRQVVVNLVGNAVKFTPGGQVIVAASTERGKRGGVTLRISVRDTGVGISAGVLPRLFDAFSQADYSTTRQFGGTGLGLAICRNLVSLMGGTIEVESEPGVGSCFRVMVELAAAAEEPPIGPRFQGLRALCLEECLEQRRSLVLELADLGFEIEEVTTPAEARKRLLAPGPKPFDICFVADAFLREDTQLMVYLEDLERQGGPGVVVSANAGHRSAPLSASFSARITKPIRRNRLVEVLVARLTDRQAGAPRDSEKFAVSPMVAAQHAGRTLVVEDNEINARIARAMLERLGWAVQSASDGVEALAVLEAASFDIVWMDCQMPRMDGFTATRALRGRERGTARTYVVALTANAVSGDREQCIEAGMDDYVSKPMRRDDLERAIKRWRAQRTSPKPLVSKGGTSDLQTPSERAAASPGRPSAKS